MKATRKSVRGLSPRDKIKFQAITRHGDKPATRMVKGVNIRPLGTNYVTVEYHGWEGFQVKLVEILEVFPRVEAIESDDGLGIKVGKDYWVDQCYGDLIKLLGIPELVPLKLLKL